MAATGDIVAPPRRAGWRATWSRLPVSFRIGAAILVVQVLVAATGPLWIPYAPSQLGTGKPLSPASWAHPFGVDQLGRDVFSRAIYGAHIDILLSLSGALLGVVIGAIAGLMSGYLRGPLDNILQRLNETLISIPFLVLALIAIAAAGPRWAGSPLLVVLVVAFVYAPRVARMARSVAIDISLRDYVTVARLRGESAWSVMRHELLPNASGVLLVELALRAGYAPILIGSLGFLGFGMRPPTPEWGLLMSENRNLLIASPMTVLGPGLLLALLVIGLNLFTEGLARILGRTVRIDAA
ncbi:MAG TPA: ABC transporter permease [Bauldia sp.]|nr:ABC transporter permease [Bauldia sp.]